MSTKQRNIKCKILDAVFVQIIQKFPEHKVIIVTFIDKSYVVCYNYIGNLFLADCIISKEIRQNCPIGSIILTNKEKDHMGKQPTKNNLIMILDVLKRHSDADHRLTQKDIQHYLKQDHELNCDRKTVKRNLMNLVEFGFDIEYKEIERGGKGSKKNVTADTPTVKTKANEDEENGNVIITDIYYNHDLEDSEAKIITDGLLFSKYISAEETRRLITKIESQTSPFAASKLKDVVNYETLGHTENPQVFYTVELLNQAIEEKKQVAFSYCDYGTDKKLHSKKKRKYTVNPYYTVTTNGKYYLICNVDVYDNLANFRVDKIKDIELLDKPQKSIRATKDHTQGFSLSDYMKDNIYMFGGRSVKAELEIDNTIIGQVIDWFGKGFKVISETESKCVISLTVDENALFYWAMQYGQFVKVLKPKNVADWVLNAARDMVMRYEEE